MKIRHKILVYFSTLAIALSGTAFILIYALFSGYRTDEFRQRIRDKTYTTLKFLVEVQAIDNEMLKIIDRNTINSLSKEKILIYNHKRKLIYESLDDTKIDFPEKILLQLGSNNRQVEFDDNGFDVVGVIFEFERQEYYGIAKAYDEYGLSKLRYLKYMLVMIFILISGIILISSFLLSRQISQPINKMAAEIGTLDFESGGYITLKSSGHEIKLLVRRFNELMKRLNNSFLFQKHAIHHISHELKTPIAALISNIERMEYMNDIESIKRGLKHQKADTRKLADIINTLLELSKVESGRKIDTEMVRIDELIFEVIGEYKIFKENLEFSVEIDDNILHENELVVPCNRKLIRLALMNLVSNCAQYSNNGKASIALTSRNGYLNIAFSNTGDVVPEEERQYIFQRFYRGRNSKGKSGFGLGLVLISKIMLLHGAYVEYKNPRENVNVFNIGLPLNSKI